MIDSLFALGPTELFSGEMQAAITRKVKGIYCIEEAVFEELTFQFPAASTLPAILNDDSFTDGASVTNGTTVVLSHATTATGTGKSFTIVARTSTPSGLVDPADPSDLTFPALMLIGYIASFKLTSGSILVVYDGAP
jgi:hypothetical protein